MDEKNEIQPTPASDVEIEPLTDEALEDVAGGTFNQTGDGSSNSCCSCSSCS